VDEIPEDLDAFFVHPLTAASRATDDGDALALLHEYRNLPLLDVPLSANKYALHVVYTPRTTLSLSSSLAIELRQFVPQQTISQAKNDRLGSAKFY